MTSAYNQGVLGQTIQDARLAAGLTQVELAKALHMGQQAISKWETGASRPQPKTIPALADAIHVDATRLLALAGYIDPSAEEWSVDIEDWVKYRYRAEEDQGVTAALPAALAGKLGRLSSADLEAIETIVDRILGVE